MNGIPWRVRMAFIGALEPIARPFLKGGVSPNAITTSGGLAVLVSAVAFGKGAFHAGGALLLVGGLLDLLDGYVARATARNSVFGAFYDSTLDRVGEMAVFTGMAVWFMEGGVTPDSRTLSVVVSIAALATSVLVSYTRARAEGLGLECKDGIAQRTERLLLLGLPMILFGAGKNGVILFWVLVVLALIALVTVVQRVLDVARTAHRIAPCPGTNRARITGHSRL